MVNFKETFNELCTKRVLYSAESEDYKKAEEKLKLILIKTDNQELWKEFERFNVESQLDIQLNAYLQGLNDGVLIGNKNK